jgi:hypothetical protein
MHSVHEYTVQEVIQIQYSTIKSVLKGHLWDKQKWSFKIHVHVGDRPLKRGSIHMKFSVRGQVKSDLLTQVTS